MQELKTWENILKEHETELNELNKPYDITTMEIHEIDERTNRIMILEQLIIEDKEIIKDIKQELNEIIPNIEEKTIKLPIIEKYNGNHPLEEKHYYEQKLQEKNIIEVSITNIQTTNNQLEITYEEY